MRSVTSFLMNRRQIALKLVMSQLGIPPTLDSFDDRLILQKKIYLAQQAGVDLGYHYYWYLRGPYSRALVGDAYDMELTTRPPRGWCLDEETKQKLSILRDFFDKLRNASKSFELYASVLFAIATGQAKRNNLQGIFQLMKNAGKNFSKNEIKKSLDAMSSANLFPSLSN